MPRITIKLSVPFGQDLLINLTDAALEPSPIMPFQILDPPMKTGNHNYLSGRAHPSPIPPPKHEES